jgi:hypothetical protein
MKEIAIRSNIEIINIVRDDIGPFDEDQLKNILEMFPYKNWEATSSEIVDNLSKERYANPGEILRSAYHENILSVNTIENDGTVYFDLGLNGEILWEEMDNKRNQEMWEKTYML